MNKLTGKTAIVTGGNSGIGYATAKKFKASGAKVVITGRSADKVRTAADELGVKGIVADVSSLSAIDSLVEQVKNEFGMVDILFVNAGIFAPAPIGHVSEEMFDHQMGINFKGAVFTLEKFLPILNDGASVINLSSVLAYGGSANMGVYSASKAALISYTRTASTELAPRKIRVNVVNPGPVETPIFGKSGMSQEQMEGMANALLDVIPLKRMGQPEDIANFVEYLASDDASFITGGEFNVDGGVNVYPMMP